MAINKIKVSTEELKSDAQSVESSIRQLENEINKLEQEFTALNSMWDGPASETFLVVFKTDLDELRKLVQDLRSFNTFETTAVNKYNQCENEVGRVVSSLRW